MNSEEVTIISIAGKQNAGKTTLIRTLIPKLKEHGHRVGTLKYNIKEFKIDHEGKDTYKYYHSGADSIALTSQDEIAVIKRVTDPPGISEIITKYLKEDAAGDVTLCIPTAFCSYTSEALDKKNTLTTFNVCCFTAIASCFTCAGE